MGKTSHSALVFWLSASVLSVVALFVYLAFCPPALRVYANDVGCQNDCYDYCVYNGQCYNFGDYVCVAGEEYECFQNYEPDGCANFAFTGLPCQ